MIPYIKELRTLSGNTRNCDVLEINNIATLLTHVLTSTGSLIVNYKGSDYATTVPYWNKLVKTKKSVFLINLNDTFINPTESEYYTEHKLYKMNCLFQKELPKLSQCDPVCRLLGFEKGDIILVGDDMYQVYDEFDKYHIGKH